MLCPGNSKVILQATRFRLDGFTQRRVKPVCFKEKISLKHLRPGLNAGGPVQLPFRITFGLCQVIYVLAAYINISCGFACLNGKSKMPFIWDIKAFQINIKFYQKVKIQTRKLLIPMERSNMQTVLYIFCKRHYSAASAWVW